jgi:diaminohydroxyphosphoribosylaminopyrimidine deaminase / 5-amino-6-(5-phosphoribosylamino)uracil reductase
MVDLRMIDERDISFLNRTLRLAMAGRGVVEPNPMVGCVITRADEVLGEGFHVGFGKAHAEPTALADCQARGKGVAGATAYVTLEPCCHTNKKTPPCAPRLISADIARVVIGCLDPNPEVNGRGVEMLRRAGVRVDALPDEGRELNSNHFRQLIAPFIARQSGRSYKTAKWAQTADGKVSGPGGSRRQISGPAATREVHRLRSRCDAIVVGIGTAMTDDPMLTPRDVPANRVPRRIVLDTRARLSSDSQLVRTARDVPTVVLHANADEDQIGRLTARGVAVVRCPTAGGSLDAKAVLNGTDLNAGDLTHVLFEPGPTLASTIVGEMDRLWVIRSPDRVDDLTARDAPSIPEWFCLTGSVRLGPDVLEEYLNTRSQAFFVADRSADLWSIT